MSAPSPAPPPQPRCPRCGARLGRLADDPSAAGDAYCGCCGLVLPAQR